MLAAAERLFEKARKDSIPLSRQQAQDYSNLLLLGSETEEMRWFLVPYEAHLYLTGCHPPLVQVPFTPRNYECDEWYDDEYLNEWDRHWNPGLWVEVESQRTRAVQPAAVSERTSQWLMTIYPANQTPTREIHLQPLKDEELHHLQGGQEVRKKKAYLSMESLYMTREDVKESTSSYVSPQSSGYFSDGEREEGQTRAKRKLKRRKGNTTAQQSVDTHNGNKCAIM